MVKTVAELTATRTTLLQRLKNWQDQSSWQDFFDTYWKLIYSAATKAGLNEAEAQDVVQETMISVAKHMPTFKYDPTAGSFKAWLLNMTRWRITDQLRKRQRRAAYDSDSPDDTDADMHMVGKMEDPVSECLDALWDAEWKKNLLDAAIDKVRRRLDPHNYQIFDFYVNKEWPSDDVAKAFGISLGQVYLAKHRVTEMITEEVKKLEEKTS